MDLKNQRGAMTLEACISVLTFLVLMLLLSSLFILFMAQNVVAHVIMQTSESLSVDVYATEALMKEDGKIGSVGDNLGQFITKLFGSSQNNPYFVSDTRWYNGDSETVQAAIRTRFVGYLSGGDEVEAERYLTNLNVVNGLDGLDFSGSYVAGDVLYIVVKYELEYDFNIWDLGKVDVEQQICSRLWK